MTLITCNTTLDAPSLLFISIFKSLDVARFSVASTEARG
jgi:hypothetical protein